MVNKTEKLVDAGEIEGGEYQVDPEVCEQFEEAAQLGAAGGRRLAEKLREYHSASPALSGGDLDAAWEDAAVGEETVGGENPTPGQNVVDELGQAVGLTYGEEEPLASEDKLARLDRVRWELDPASSEDYAERMKFESGGSTRRTLGGLPAPQPLAGDRNASRTQAGKRHRRHNR